MYDIGDVSDTLGLICKRIPLLGRARRCVNEDGFVSLMSM